MLLGFTRSADLACTWYYYVIPCNPYSAFLWLHSIVPLLLGQGLIYSPLAWLIYMTACKFATCRLAIAIAPRVLHYSASLNCELFFHRVRVSAGNAAQGFGANATVMGGRLSPSVSLTHSHTDTHGYTYIPQTLSHTLTDTHTHTYIHTRTHRHTLTYSRTHIH